MHPPSEQAKMAISRPIAVYDDVSLEQDSDSRETKLDDLPEKLKCPVVMYDDVLPWPSSEKNLKGDNTEKPKVMYDEVILWLSEKEHVHVALSQRGIQPIAQQIRSKLVLTTHKY